MCQQDAQRRSIPHDVWTPMITNDHSLRNKSLRGCKKVAHVELLRGLCRDMLRLQKPATQEEEKITTTFGKSLFLIKYRMHYATYMPPNTKDLATNQAMVAYGNRQNATAFARANNSDLLRSLKHLMETRFRIQTNYIVPHDKTVF